MSHDGRQHLRVAGIAKSFNGVPALRGVTFHVRPGRVHFLVGGNGSGKSTLIKILAGICDADAGEVTVGAETVAAGQITPHWSRRVGLAFVHQDPGVFADLSVAENLVAGRGYPRTRLGKVDWAALHAHARQLIERFHLEVEPGTPLAKLGPAKRTMVAIARALQDGDAAASAVLVLDEPTASLPAHEATALLEKLRRYADAGHTIVVVSHRLDEVLEGGDDLSVLRDGRLVATRPVAQVTRTELVRLIVGHELDEPVTKAVADGGEEAERPLLELFDGDGARPVLRVRAGEIVGLAGLLGSGRSRMLRGMFGLEAGRAGRTRVDGQAVTSGVKSAVRAGIAYLPEDRDGEATFPDLTVRQNLSANAVGRYWHHLRFDKQREARAAGEALAEFGIKAASDRLPVAALSGGNRQKVVLARWMRIGPRVLLLDEPTQGVDVGARSDIHRLLRESAADGTAVVVASSDLEELELLCDRVVVLVQGKVAHELTGGAINAKTIAARSFDTDGEVVTT
ncbi:MAG: sugar ABC transporter ATP-binding protein [Solirubrobacteraceae bacterium]